jgi:hypothetical protein
MAWHQTSAKKSKLLESAQELVKSILNILSNRGGSFISLAAPWA